MTRKWSVVFCVDLTELHWITKRSLQSGTPNTHSINSLSSKPFYWIQTFAGIFENLQHTTLSFTLVDLLGSCQQEYKEQEKYTQTFSKQGGQSQSDKALFSNSNMCRTTQWRPSLLHCAGTVLGVPMGDHMKTVILIIGRYLLRKFWCQGSQMLFSWFTLVFLAPQLQEGAKM